MPQQEPIRHDLTPEPLNISPEKVFFIMVKAREVDAKVAPNVPDEASNASDDGQRAILEDLPGDPTYIELSDAINSLNEDETIDLIALSWLGRGDFSRNEWADARALAGERHKAESADYLTGMPLLADYLAEGLDELGYSTEEFTINRL